MATARGNQGRQQVGADDERDNKEAGHTVPLAKLQHINAVYSMRKKLPCISVYVEQDVYDRLKKMAADDDRSVSKFVERLIIGSELFEAELQALQKTSRAET